MKQEMIKSIKGEPIELNERLVKAINNIWLDGYNKGLADMDKMHGKIDNLIK